MKKSLLALLLIFPLSLSGCVVNMGDYSYKNSGKYSPLSGELRYEFTELDIGWISGNVYIEKGEGFSVSESARNGIDEKYRLYFWADGNTLHIRYTESGIKLKNNINKDLRITVPYDIDRIEADVVSADIVINGLTVDELDVNAVSGDVDIINSKVDDIDVGFVSSNIDMENVVADKIALKGVSGDITAVFSDVPDKIEADTVSGNIRLLLPEDTTFTASFNTVSGSPDIEFPCTVVSKKYIVGDGSGCDIGFKSVSGNLKIKVNK